MANIEEPYQVILGSPFLKQHRIAIVPGNEPQLPKSQDGTLKPIDLFDDLYGPPTLVEQMDGLDKEGRGGLAAELAQAIRRPFPVDTPLTADYLAKCTTRHWIRLVDDKKIHNQHGFAIPHKWCELWKRMLEEHLVAGRLRPSTSPYASAVFVVPKRDLTADPRWVNVYRSFNANTVKDWTLLPLPDVVLADAACAKVWGKIHMTNAFFQTPMLAEDIEKTAICLTSIEAMWNAREEKAFEAVKRIVTSLPVLKPLDQDLEVPIWPMTDASKVGCGAVLLQGQDSKTVSPCRFYSRQYIAAEKN
ncbi:hypothetical protein JCM3770_003260 [Rhodotorula araucariae]